MSLPAILAAFVVLSGQEAQTPFSQPQGVSEPSRLAVTPNLDGKIGADEWDGFTRSGDSETYMQWEPGKLYIAAKMPEGRDLVLSLDTKQDGWLVGKDNLEFRLRLVSDKVVITARLLDATNVDGPKWIDLPGFSQSSQGAGTSDGTNVQLEAMLIDPGLNQLPIKENERFLARMDVVAQSSQSSEPFLPRAGTLVRMAMSRASAMPVGLNWNIEDSGRVFTPGSSTKIRFTFNTKEEEQPVKKIEIKPIGALAEQTTSIGIPFPALDKKGRAFVDYETKTEKTAPLGYHLLAGTLITSDGAPAMIQASFRIAPLIDFELVNGGIHSKTVAQTIKIPFIIHSNSTRRLDGFCDVVAPENWEILKGDDKSFIIYNARSGVRRVLTVTIPANAKGAFPIKFTGRIGQQTIEETGWVTIEEK